MSEKPWIKVSEEKPKQGMYVVEVKNFKGEISKATWWGVCWYDGVNGDRRVEKPEYWR